MVHAGLTHILGAAQRVAGAQHLRRVQAGIALQGCRAMGIRQWTQSSQGTILPACGWVGGHAYAPRLWARAVTAEGLDACMGTSTGLR